MPGNHHGASVYRRARPDMEISWQIHEEDLLKDLSQNGYGNLVYPKTNFQTIFLTVLTILVPPPKPTQNHPKPPKIISKPFQNHPKSPKTTPKPVQNHPKTIKVIQTHTKSPQNPKFWPQVGSSWLNFGASWPSWLLLGNPFWPSCRINKIL